jgi:hypothetical protein
MTLAADTVVPAVPLKPNTKLMQELEGTATEVHAIGDCIEPGVIIDATDAAYRNANAV